MNEFGENEDALGEWGKGWRWEERERGREGGYNKAAFLNLPSRKWISVVP